LDAETACAWGLVNKVVADAELMTAARAVAARLAALPPEALRLTKDLIKNGRDNVDDRIEQELALFRERLHSPEAAEAFAAFVEKRQPDFSRFS
jgi:enoyl-CoA hydratase/carnithine racemase